MTNKDYMATLCTEHLEAVMHALYFEPALWVEGPECVMHSTPNMFLVIDWLKSPHDPDSKFWRAILDS